MDQFDYKMQNFNLFAQFVLCTNLYIWKPQDNPKLDSEISQALGKNLFFIYLWIKKNIAIHFVYITIFIQWKTFYAMQNILEV